MNSGLFMKCLVQGNLTRQEAESIYLKARAVLNLKGDKSVKVGHICPNAIPVGKTTISSLLCRIVRIDLSIFKFIFGFRFTLP